jgi:hypothetical protein
MDHWLSWPIICQHFHFFRVPKTASFMSDRARVSVNGRGARVVHCSVTSRKDTGGSVLPFSGIYWRKHLLWGKFDPQPCILVRINLYYRRLINGLCEVNLVLYTVHPPYWHFGSTVPILGEDRIEPMCEWDIGAGIPLRLEEHIFQYRKRLSETRQISSNKRKWEFYVFWLGQKEALK